MPGLTIYIRPDFIHLQLGGTPHIMARQFYVAGQQDCGRIVVMTTVCHQEPIPKEDHDDNNEEEAGQNENARKFLTCEIGCHCTDH